MKKLMLPVALMTLLFSCGKKNKFECGLQQTEKPANDTAVLFTPNAFSPNGDGLNDRFGMYGYAIKSIQWEVYDQEYNMLFSASDLKHFWEPSMALEKGLTPFYYKLQAITEQGNTISRCGEFYVYTCVPEGYSMQDIIFPDQYNPNMPEGFIKGSSHETFQQCTD